MGTELDISLWGR